MISIVTANITVNPPSTSSGTTKKGKNQNHTNETFIIGHNLQPSTSPRTDQSEAETIDAGNLQITVQQNKNDMAITIGKKENKTKQDKNVTVEVTHQDETQPKKNTPAFTRKTTTRKKSPGKK
ncbi:uncharacterized protein LOC126551769 isoform X2 [Aphis gossypii]|uniref:Uncharacterized protein n=1 Tax=Aphis gossypii TaxID=80765 RepID=A0A9P0JDG0_APHGO|nr:uncharacterized protein LOC126551769 isoform X2 [Aphis gossypii]CAH1732725.1 unnamed protein product [Aphis gossypii]